MKTYLITLSFLLLGLIIQAQHLIVDGTAKVGLGGERNVLLELNSERSWVFRQLGTGASTALELMAANPNNNNKSFVINTTGKFEMRRMIYTTNPVEALHRIVRKMIKGKAAWVSDTALMKQIYLSLMHNEKSWRRKAYGWTSIQLELFENYEERIGKWIQQ